MMDDDAGSGSRSWSPTPWTTIPPELAALMDNCVVLVEDDAAAGDPDLLGLYDGTPLTERGPRLHDGAAGPDHDLPQPDARDVRDRGARSSTRCGSPSCTRSRTTSASTTTGCTSSATPDGQLRWSTTAPAVWDHYLDLPVDADVPGEDPPGRPPAGCRRSAAAVGHPVGRCGGRSSGQPGPMGRVAGMAAHGRADAVVDVGGERHRRLRPRPADGPDRRRVASEPVPPAVPRRRPPRGLHDGSSTYMLDTRLLLAAGEVPVAFLYLFGTLLTGLLAVWIGMVSARGLVAAAVHRAGRSRK